MKFWKMHGLGNDYIVIDNRKTAIKEENIPAIAKRLCERRFSVGADGLILASNSAKADIKMRIFNLDGSEAEMCGNGIRCFSKYCYENDIVKKKEQVIETRAGLKKTKLTIKDKTVTHVYVDLGMPIFEKTKIPMQGQGNCINEELIVDGESFRITCLSIGNPHCVIFVNNIDCYPVKIFGPKIENHPNFPNRINVVFVEVVEKGLLKVRVWERGCGETLACGTGASAAVIAGNVVGKTKNKVKAILLGGELKIEYNKTVSLKGPVEKVFEGRLF
ncbi:diaminopimelate epimerase [Candidatus Bathyarchaeota archaeon]|nr:diaminopimelate epimerase [Candidatus Bathyarchaeota archaeon]